VLAALVICAVPATSAAAAEPEPGPGAPRFGAFIFREPFNAVEMRRLREGGGEVIRATFTWADVQRTILPVYAWSKYDALVARSARQGLSILPLLIGSPGFAAPNGAHPPTEPLTKHLFARYAAEAVERYGHDGELWAEHPELPYRPIEVWEVWNEPNLRGFWTDGDPNPREYAELLGLVSEAIRHADRRAKVVLAGLASPRSPRAFDAHEFLADLYEVPGFSESFDIGAAHPYGGTVRGVERRMAAIRRVMDQNGDAEKPLWITELGWSSTGIDHYLVKDPVTQAQLTRETIEMLEDRADDFGLGTVIWFRWQDPEQGCPKPGGCWFDQAGLFTVDGEPKPAWRAFAEATGGAPRAGSLPPDALDRLLAAITGG
jgi:hypothetical protein